MVISTFHYHILVKSNGQECLNTPPHSTHSHTPTKSKPSSLISLFSLPHLSLSRPNHIHQHSPPFLFIFFNISSLSSQELHHSSLHLHFEVRPLVACWVWSRNRALVLMSLGSLFWWLLKMNLRWSWMGLYLYLTKASSWFITFGNDSQEEPNVYMYVMILKLHDFELVSCIFERYNDLLSFWCDFSPCMLVFWCYMMR